jgi:transposase-like protein
MDRGWKTIVEIAAEVGVSQNMLHRWRERFEPELTQGTQPSQDDPEDVERLRRKLRDLESDSLLKKPFLFSPRT